MSNLEQTAQQMLSNAQFTRNTSRRWSRQVSENVWLRATINVGDERIALSWQLLNGVNVADDMSVMIDTNGGRIIAALAATWVDAD